MMTSPLMTPTRRQIVRLLWSQPGLCTREVARAVDVDETTAEYHLYRLARGGVVVTERLGRIAAHFPKGWGNADARRYQALPEKARRVIDELRRAGWPMRAVDLARLLDMRVSAVRFALVRACSAGLVRPIGRGQYEVVE